MIRSRRGDSTTKRARVAATVEHMLAADTPITFAAVARHARVSSWLVYAPGVRDLIDQARTRQTSPGPGDRPVDTHSPGLRTDLALARAEITRLRGERDQQRQQLQLALGARLDNVSKADLITRVDELTATNTDLAATTTRQRSDNQFLQQRVRDLEDDLAAARHQPATHDPGREPAAGARTMTHRHPRSSRRVRNVRVDPCCRRATFTSGRQVTSPCPQPRSPPPAARSCSSPF